MIPEDIPLTTPELLTVPTAVFEEDHTPPEVELVSVVVDPTHTLLAPPLIDATVGVAVTVSNLVTLDPHVPRYVMYTVPALTPLRIPVVRPIVARDVLLEDHVPPVALFVYVVAAATHGVLLPPIAPGASEIVTCVVELVSVPLVLQVPVPVQVITQ